MDTNLHKIIGFVVGVAAPYIAKWFGLDMSAEVQASLTLGIFLIVSVFIGKRTNPTGAYKSDTRKALEDVATEQQVRTNTYVTSRGVDHDRL